MASIVELIDAFHGTKISASDYLKGLDRHIHYAEQKLLELDRQKIVAEDQALWKETLLPGLKASFEGMIGAATEAKEYAKARDEKILHGVGILLVGIGTLMEKVEAASGKVSASTQQALQSLSEMPHDGIEITASPVKGSAESSVGFLD